MAHIPYVLDMHSFRNPLKFGVLVLDETTNAAELADIHARTDKTSKPFTHAIQATYGRSKRLLLFVSFEDTSNPEALFHLWLPSYYNKYGEDKSYA